MKLAFWRRPRQLSTRERLAQLEHVLDLRLESLTASIRASLNRPKPCGVSMLHQLAGEPGWMISHFSFELAAGETREHRVLPQQNLARGAMFAAWGPCSIVEVLVGSKVQSVWPDSNGGPTVITADACPVGTQIRFLLRGWGA